MTSQECLGGKIDQIWFGLISINRKNQKKKQRNKKKQKQKTMFSSLVWKCLDPSSPQNIVLFLFVLFCLGWVGWLTTLSSISPRKGLCMDSKRPIWF